MEHYYDFPIPHQRIWAAAFLHDKYEVIELRTETEEEAKPYTVLYHNEYPAGTALSDFVDLSLGALLRFYHYIEDAVWELNHSQDEPEIIAYSVKKLHYTSAELLNLCGIFAPVAASVEMLALAHIQGEPVSLDGINTVLAECRDMHTFIKRVLSSEYDSQEELLLRYFRLQKEQGYSLYPILKYSRVFYEAAATGVACRFPYDPWIMRKVQGDANMFPVATVNTNSPKSFTYFLLSKAMRKNLHFRVCKYCGRTFAVVGNYRAEYCDRLIVGSNRTCKEAGALRLYEKRKLGDPAIREYKRSYKAHNARIRYGLMTKDEFKAWSVEARKRRDSCIRGETTLEEFKAWLDSDKLT